MRIGLQLIDSDSQIRSKILDAIRDYLQPAFDKAQRALQTIIPNKTKAVLMGEPEYNSLLSGQLRSELGVPDAASRIESLFTAWTSSMVIRSTPLRISSRGVTGGFSIDMIRSDFSDILSLSAATITDDISGSVIPWLQWLLLDGSKILIRDYAVQFGPNSRSRTGNAIMISSEKQNWRVPSEFAGTVNNNWITRAIDRLDPILLNDIEKELEKHI